MINKYGGDDQIDLVLQNKSNCQWFQTLDDNKWTERNELTPSYFLLYLYIEYKQFLEQLIHIHAVNEKVDTQLCK